VENKSSWSRVDVSDEHTISGAVSGHFSYFAAGGVGQVQFMTSSVYCQAVVHRYSINLVIIITTTTTVITCGIHALVAYFQILLSAHAENCTWSLCRPLARVSYNLSSVAVF